MTMKPNTQAQTLADAVRAHFERSIKLGLNLKVLDALAAYDAATEQVPEPENQTLESDAPYGSDEHRRRLSDLVGEAEAQRIWANVVVPRIAQPPQPEAKPCDWMRAALLEMAKWACDNQHRIAGLVEYLSDVFEEIFKEHCPNAAGDAREVSAKEFVTWLTAKYEKTEHQPTAWAVSGELNHMMEESARAKASQTPNAAQQ